MNYPPGVQTAYPTTDDERPLPIASITYQINVTSQGYASVATNFKTSVNYALYDAGTYSTKTYLHSTLASPDQAAEISISEELGYRYQGSIVRGYATYFHYNFTNRQFSTGVTELNGAVEKATSTPAARPPTAPTSRSAPDAG